MALNARRKTGNDTRCSAERNEWRFHQDSINFDCICTNSFDLVEARK